MTQLTPESGGQIASPASGRLDRPTGKASWPVPAQVERRGEDLVWADQPSNTVTSAPAPWAGFLKFADASDDQIVAYARRWGVLRLCRNHDLPCDHPNVHQRLAGSGGLAIVLEEDGVVVGQVSATGLEKISPTKSPDDIVLTYFDSRCPVADLGGGWRGERFQAWRTWATRAKGLLNVAALLADRKLAAEKQWTIACDWDGLSLEPRARLGPPRTLTEARGEVARIANHWLKLGQVSAMLRWATEMPAMAFLGGGLFGALALQLALAVCQGDSFGICSNCGVPYPILRHTKSGQRNYCPDCRAKGVPSRDAKRDERMRKRKRTLGARTSRRPR